MLLASDYRFEVQLLRDSDLACGLKVHSNEVAAVDIQPLLSDKSEAVSQVH